MASMEGKRFGSGREHRKKGQGNGNKINPVFKSENTHRNKAATTE